MSPDATYHNGLDPGRPRLDYYANQRDLDYFPDPILIMPVDETLDG